MLKAPKFWYYKRDKLVSIDSINDPVSYMVGKKFLEINKNPDPKDIVSTKIDLKKLLREIKWELLVGNGKVEKLIFF